MNFQKRQEKAKECDNEIKQEVTSNLLLRSLRK